MKFANIALIQFIIIGIGAWCYSLGGREKKLWRRIVGSLICSTALWIGLLLMGKTTLCSLLIYPLLIVGFSLGYGSDNPFTKVVKRTLIVLFCTLTGLLMCLLLGGRSWLILPLQAFIGAGSIWLGVKNPVHTSIEEFFVCLLLTECLILYPFIA